MEAGHGKCPYDPIGGTAKRKTGLAVKNNKTIIQNVHKFHKCTKETEETSSIKFTFLSTQKYENAAFSLSQACGAIEAVKGTMKLLAVSPHEPNQIWAREMWCFFASCFNINLQPNTACKGWRIANLKTSNALERPESNGSHNIIPEINENAVRVYDRKKNSCGKNPRG